MKEYDDFFTGVVHSSRFICGFVGEYRWLSNFYPCSVEWGGLTYRSAEAAYQASKFYVEQRAEFTKLSPGEAKSLAKSMTMSAAARGIWEHKKDRVMRGITFNKFTQDYCLGEKLICTGSRYLEETNWWGDTHFGVCREVGANVLGSILTEVRAELVRLKLEGGKPLEAFLSDKGIHCSKGLESCAPDR